MKALKNKLFSTREKYDVAWENLNDKIKEVCDFNAQLTLCASDGHLILNEKTASVATLNCLNGKTVKNKLTEQEHSEYCI